MKMKELTTKSSTELRSELKRLQEEVDEKLIKRRTGQTKNVKEVYFIKKDIARILTILSAKK